MTCRQHPLAPHGFCRDASFMNEEYTCECDYLRQEIVVPEGSVIKELNL